MPIQFNVSQLLKSGVGQVRWYDFELDEPMDLDGARATDLHGSVKFSLTNFGIVATVEGQALIDLACARCLEPFKTEVSVGFQEEYRPTIDVATGLPSNLPESDTTSQISRNHQIDLGEALRQELLLNIEIIPVCTPECRGLCPVCGTNLNTEPCGCDRVETANPFAVLAGLLTESND